MIFIANIVYAVLNLAGALPLRLRIHAGRALGRIFALFPARESEIARLQISLFLKAPGQACSVAQIYAGLGQTVMECLNLEPLLKESSGTISCPDGQGLEILKGRATPILALTAHLANWDLLAAYMIRQGVPLVTVGREANSPLLHRILERIRSRYGTSTIWRGDRSAVRQIISALGEKKVVGAVIDQDTLVRSLYVPFFGYPARSPSTLVELGKRHDARIFSVFILRTSLSSYLVRIEELNSAAPVDQILGEFNSRLEGYIRQYPEQWVWFHKRWRSNQQGERMSSMRYIEFLQAELERSRLTRSGDAPDMGSPL